MDTYINEESFLMGNSGRVFKLVMFELSFSSEKKDCYVENLQVGSRM